MVATPLDSLFLQIWQEKKRKRKGKTERKKRKVRVMRNKAYQKKISNAILINMVSEEAIIVFQKLNIVEIHEQRRETKKKGNNILFIKGLKEKS